MADSNPVTIQKNIVDLLGLQDEIEYSWEEYYRFLKEASIASTLSKSLYTTEEAEVIIEELKRVKKLNKTTVFSTVPESKTKTKKIDVKKLFGVSKFAESQSQKKSSSNISFGSLRLSGSKAINNNSTPEEESRVEEKKEKKEVRDDKLILKRLSSIETIVNSILSTLEKQFKFDKKSSEKERKSEEEREKKKRENKLESPLKGGFKSLTKMAQKAVSPLENIFETVKNFITWVLLGRAFTMFSKWISDPQNKKDFETIADFIGDHWILLGGALLLFGTGLGSFITTLLASIVKLVVRMGVIIATKLIPFLAKLGPRGAAIAAGVGLFAAGAVVPELMPETVSDEADKQADKAAKEKGNKQAAADIRAQNENRNIFQQFGDFITGASQEREEQAQRLETGKEKRYGFFGEIKEESSSTTPAPTTPTDESGDEKTDRNASDPYVMSDGSTIKPGDTVGYSSGGFVGGIQNIIQNISDRSKELNLIKFFRNDDQDPELISSGGIGESPLTIGGLTDTSSPTLAPLKVGVSNKNKSESGISVKKKEKQLSIQDILSGINLFSKPKKPQVDPISQGVPVTGAGRDDTLVRANVGDAILTEKDQRDISKQIKTGTGLNTSESSPVYNYTNTNEQSIIAVRKGETILTPPEQQSLLLNYGVNVPELLANRSPNKIPAKNIKTKDGLNAFSKGGLVKGYFLGGIVKGIGKAIGSVGKAIGGAVKGIVSSPIGQVLGTVASAVIPGAAPIVAGINAISGIASGDVLGGITSGLGALTGGLGNIFPGAKGIFDTIGNVGGAIAGAIGGFTRDPIGSITGAIGSIGNAIPGVGDFLGGIGNKIGGFLGGAKDFIGGIGQKISGIGGGLGGFIETITGGMSNAKESVTNFIGKILPGGLDQALPGIGDFIGKISGGLDGVIPSLGEMVNNIVPGASDFIGNVLGKAGEIIPSIQENIGGVLGNVLGPIQNIIGNIQGGIGKVGEIFGKDRDIGGAVSEILSSIIPTIQQSIGGAFNAISTPITNVIGSVSSTVSNILGGIDFFGMKTEAMTKQIQAQQQQNQIQSMQLGSHARENKAQNSQIAVNGSTDRKQSVQISALGSKIQKINMGMDKRDKVTKLNLQGDQIQNTKIVSNTQQTQQQGGIIQQLQQTINNIINALNGGGEASQPSGSGNSALDSILKGAEGMPPRSRDGGAYSIGKEKETEEAESSSEPEKKTPSFGNIILNKMKGGGFVPLNNLNISGIVKENTGLNIKGATADRQLAAVQPGEYVLPKGTVDYLGKRAIDSMVSYTDSDSKASKIGIPKKNISENIKPYESSGSKESGMTVLPRITEGGGGMQPTGQMTGMSEIMFPPISYNSSAVVERERIMDTLGFISKM